MAGQGKYTTYSGVNQPPEKREFLRKLFKGDSEVVSPPEFLFQDHPTAVETANEYGNKWLRAEESDGIVRGNMVTGDVDLSYSGRGSALISPPNTNPGEDVTWKQAGDASSSYVPDITSPGVGKTDGLDKDSDPGIDVTEIKPGYDPTSSNLKSPHAKGNKIYSLNKFGTVLPKGRSTASN